MKFWFTFPQVKWWDGSLDSAALQRIGQAAERAGFSACGVSDHPFPRMEESVGAHHTLDPFVTMSFIAAATERIGLHFNVLVGGYRNPFLVANGVASLDQLAPGRVILGLGSGYLADEFAALGSEFATRHAVLDEVVDAFRAAWPGGPVTYEGRFFRASGNSLRDAVVDTPAPRIWLGGNGERAARRAAHVGDGWCPVMHPPGSRLASRPVGPQGAARTTAISTTDDLAERISQVRAAVPPRHVGAHPFEICVVRGGEWRFESWDAFEREVSEFEAAGADWIALHMDEHGGVSGLIDHIEQFGDRIISRFTESPAER